MNECPCCRARQRGAATIKNGVRQFGSRVRDLRKSQGLTQQDLADALSYVGRSYHQVTIAKLEGGSRPTSVAEVLMLAAVLGVDVADLFKGMQ